MTDSFDYTPNDLINPIGANDLSSFAMYYQRALYEEKIYPLNAAWPIDLWYNKQLYGKVDRAQNSIHTTGPSLQPISAASVPNLFALGPVVRAFQAFAAHMRKANIMGVATDRGNPKLYDVQAHQAFVNPIEKYNAYLQGAYQVYHNLFTPEQNEKILSFPSFVDDYKSYLLEVVRTYPVTQTNFFLTPSVSPFSTGLAISIDNGDCGDDNYKYVNYLSDPNYDFYTKVAKKFGFIVNRNAPWILWADIFSSAFLVNLQYYYVDDNPQPVNKDTFFQSFYEPTWRTDIARLRQAFVDGYNTLIYRKPYAEVFPPRMVSPGTTHFQENCQLKKIIKSRPPLNEAGIEKVLTDKFMIDFYIELRQAEAATPDVNPEEVRAYAYERYRNQLNNSLTKMENAVKYINSVYSPYVYSIQNLATAFPEALAAAQQRAARKTI